MSTSAKAHSLSRVLEGGVFYPTGYIVAGIARPEDAQALHDRLIAAGYEEDDCILVRPDEMLHDAESELGGNTVLAFLGSSAQVRQQHLNLAREGCSFLLVYAPTGPETARVMRLLSRVPVRYAVQYHRFTIEDLIERLPSAASDAKTARTGSGGGEANS